MTLEVNQSVVLGALRSCRFTFNTERELQDGIAQALQSAGIEFKREQSLSTTDRPDFLIGSIAIEVKVKGSLASVTRQIHRYMLYEEVSCLILVTACASHHNLPRIINHKPVALYSLIMENAF